MSAERERPHEQIALARRLRLTLGALVVVLPLLPIGCLVGADRQALWHVVHDLCVTNQRTSGNPAPCEEVHLARGEPDDGYAVLKDLLGRTQYLLIPTRRLDGIESPELLAADAPNYWRDAWVARTYVFRALAPRCRETPSASRSTPSRGAARTSCTSTSTACDAAFATRSSASAASWVKRGSPSRCRSTARLSSPAASTLPTSTASTHSGYSPREMPPRDATWRRKLSSSLALPSRVPGRVSSFSPRALNRIATISVMARTSSTTTAPSRRTWREGQRTNADEPPAAARAVHFSRLRIDVALPSASASGATLNRSSIVFRIEPKS